MTTPSLNKKLRKGQKTREKIIEQAIDLFFELGFAETSTRMLVQRVGMTSSAIYNHFTDKEQILFIIIRRAGEKVLSALREINEEFDDPEVCLRYMITRMLNFFKESEAKKEVAIFIEQVTCLSGEYKEKCNQQHREIFEIFQAKVRELRDKKQTRPISETVAAFGILGAMNWVYLWFKDDGSMAIEDIAEDLSILLLSGLLTVQG